jgi:hypothetical protein
LVVGAADTSVAEVAGATGLVARAAMCAVCENAHTRDFVLGAARVVEGALAKATALASRTHGPGGTGAAHATALGGAAEPWVDVRIDTFPFAKHRAGTAGQSAATIDALLEARTRVGASATVVPVGLEVDTRAVACRAGGRARARAALALTAALRCSARAGARAAMQRVFGDVDADLATYVLAGAAGHEAIGRRERTVGIGIFGRSTR